MGLAIVTVGTVFYIMGEQLICRGAVGWTFQRIIDTAASTHEKLQDREVKRELQNLRAVQEKKESLGFITRVVGVFELISFALLTLYLGQHHSFDSYEIGLDLAKFVAGWLAIKTFGNYGQWSGNTFGRATFYMYLFGTFFNLASGVILGVIWWSLLP